MRLHLTATGPGPGPLTGGPPPYPLSLLPRSSSSRPRQGQRRSKGARPPVLPSPSWPRGLAGERRGTAAPRRARGWSQGRRRRTTMPSPLTGSRRTGDCGGRAGEASSVELRMGTAPLALGAAADGPWEGERGYEPVLPRMPRRPPSAIDGEESSGARGKRARARWAREARARYL
jgi:hypothetical protein